MMQHALRRAASRATTVGRNSPPSSMLARASSTAASTTTSSNTSISFHKIEPAPSLTSTTLANSVPLPRSSHGISAINSGSRLLIYGGENIPRTPITDPSQGLWLAERRSKDTIKYPFGNEVSYWQWVSPEIVANDGTEDAPTPRVGHSQAAVNDSVYVFGGRTGVGMGEEALGDMWKLDIHDDGEHRGAEWTKIGDCGNNNAPEPRSFHKMISISTDLYMFGGCGSNGRLNDMWKFDTLTNTWRDLGSSHLLRGRGGPSLLSLSGAEGGTNGVDKVAVASGFAGEETNDGHAYQINDTNVEDGGWWEVDNMSGLKRMSKRSVSCFGSFPPLNRCIIFGGEVDPSKREHEGAGNFENDVVILDGTTGEVLEVMTKPTDDGDDDKDVEWPEERGWADAAVSGNSMFLFGGLTGDDKKPVRLNDLWECNVSVTECSGT